jgi:hypothetical protein
VLHETEKSFVEVISVFSLDNIFSVLAFDGLLPGLGLCGIPLEIALSLFSSVDMIWP